VQRVSQHRYKGRLGIFEMVEMNNELRELAYKRSPTSDLRKAARASGMRTLAEDGCSKSSRAFRRPRRSRETRRSKGHKGIT